MDPTDVQISNRIGKLYYEFGVADYDVKNYKVTFVIIILLNIHEYNNKLVFCLAIDGKF
jgi:hypothetical protein